MKESKTARLVRSERMSDFGFTMMSYTMSVMDFLAPRIDGRVASFGIREGMTAVDYGCGPGRYTLRFSRLVGEAGKVYAVDIHRLAIEAVDKKIAWYGLKNVTPVLAEGYHSGVPDHVADVVCVIDLFFAIQDPTAFLGEMKRIARADGRLVIDPGHEPMENTRQKILASGHWEIVEQAGDHFKCKPVE